MTTDEDNADAAIAFENVHKSFGEKAVLRGVNLEIPRHKTTCILGGSGSGKSVTLKLIMRLLEPDEGRILLDGEDIAHVEGKELDKARRKLGVLFQSGALLQSLTVAENVALPLIEVAEAPADEIEAKVSELLESLKLADSSALLPGAISGGMRKRVALARALVLEPKVILYDEPTSGLDPVNAAAVDHMIKDMQASREITQVVVTHSMASVFHIADRVAMLHEGTIVFDGTPDEARETDQEVVKHFLSADAEEVHAEVR